MRRRNPPEFNPLIPIALAGTAAAVLYYLYMEPSTSDKVAFVKKFAPIDVAISRREGFPPGVLSGWAAMESAWATSGLAKEANNLFGIKADAAWQADKKPFVVKGTHEYQGTAQAISTEAAFRAYASWQDSVEDLIAMLKRLGRYHGALDSLQRKDVTGFLKGIAASGYSTAKDYDVRISNFLRDISQLKIA